MGTSLFLCGVSVAKIQDVELRDGFVILWRKLLDSAIFSDSYAFHIATHLIMEANHKTKKILFNGKQLEVLRGSCITGRYSISKKTGINPSKVYRVMKLLKNISFLDIKTNNKFSIVTILNYGFYQNPKNYYEQQDEQQLNNKRTTTEQQLNTNKNVKNVKNANKIKSMCISSIFNYFRTSTDKSKSYNLSDKRCAMIRGRLKDYPVGDLKKAIDAFAVDDWKERKNNFGLEYCMGSIERTDKWISRFVEPKIMPKMNTGDFAWKG